MTVPSGFVQTWGLDLLPAHRTNARIAQFNNLLFGLAINGAASDANAAMPARNARRFSGT